MRRPLRLAAGVAAVALAGLIPAGDGRRDDAPAIAVAGPAGVRLPPSEPLPDPFPLRRVFVPADRLDAIARQAGPGGLVRLPRDAFEGRVRAAAVTTRDAADPPRLVRAAYRATLSPGGLAGSADWDLAYPGGSGGTVPLDALRVAVWNPRWAGGRPAVVFPGLPARPGPALLADSPRDTALTLEWSARGTEEPAAERYDLGFPPSVIATLDLDLPADREPTVTQTGVLLSGPFPAADGRKVWRVAFAGLGRVELVVRRPGREGEPPPAVRVGRTARVAVAPGEATAAYDFDLEAVRGTIGDLVFEADPGLKVSAVSGSAAVSWRTEGKAGGPTRVRVLFRDAPPSARVSITGTMVVPSPPPPAWTCPRVRLLNGLPSTDGIEVRIDPDLKFVGCDPCDYRVADAGADDDGYRVGFTGTPVAEATSDRRPPALRLRGGGPEYTTSEDVTWTVGTGVSTLTAKYRVKVTRGPMPQIAFAVPPGYAVESVGLSPDDPGVAVAAGPNGTWVVEPSRAIATGGAVDVRLDLRGPPGPRVWNPAGGPVTESHPFPRIAPVGAAERDGRLRLLVGAGLTAVATPPVPRSGEYEYRTREPDGVVAVAAIRPVATVVRDTTASVAAGRVAAATHFRLGVRAGEIGALTVFAPERPGFDWDISPPAGATAVRTPSGAFTPATGLFAAGGGWGALAGCPVVGAVGGSIWEVRLDRPTGGEIVLGVTCRFPAAGGRPIALPIPTVLGVEVTRAGIGLDPSAVGVFDQPRPVPPTTFPAGTVLNPLGTMAPPDARTRRWRFADLRLDTRVGGDGVVSCSFGGRVVDAGEDVLSVVLPDGSRPTEVRVAGRAADLSVPDSEAPKRVRFRLTAAEPGGVDFQVRYQFPCSSAGVLTSFRSPAPELPGNPVPTRSWSVASEFLVVAEAGATGDVITGIRATWVSAGSSTLAVLLVALGVAAGVRGSRVAVACLGFGTAGLGAALWVIHPVWQPLLLVPTLASLLVLGLSLPGWTGRHRAAPTRPASAVRRDVWPGPAVVPVLAAVLVAGGVGVAQAPDPAIVYVTPATGPGRFDVLAPRAVLTALAGLTRSPVTAPVVVAAEYEGVADSVVTVEARFTVWCPGDEAATLALPIAGAKLEAATVDGRPAFPEAAGADAYTVGVRGSGFHEVRVRFGVGVVTSGADREVKFGVPDVAAVRVGFAVPAGSGGPDVVTRRGSQVLARVGGRPHARADHGGGSIVVVRWRTGTAPGANPVVSVREACVWDLRESGSSAVAAFLFRVESGSVAKLRIDVPGDLEPARVVVRSADPRTTGVGLRDWRITPGGGAWQAVELGLQGPTDGSVVVVMRLYPRRPLAGRPTLRFPRAKNSTEANSFAAFRPSGVVIDDVARTGVIDYPADGFAKEFAFAPELALDRFPPARVFRRSGDGVPEVRPVLRPTAGAVAGSAKVAWVVGSRADAGGDVSVTGKDGGISFAEFDVQGPVQVHEVRAAGIAAWSQVGSRVQVWLRKPVTKAVDVRWSGTLTGYQRSGRPGSDPGPVDLPLPILVGGDPGGAEFTVRAAPGWAVTLPPTKGVRVVGPDKIVADSPAPPAVKFTGTPPDPPAGVDAVTAVDRTPTGVAWHQWLAVPVRAGRPGSFMLRVTGLPAGVRVDLRGPKGTQIAGPTPGPEGVSWVVTFAAGDASEIDLAVSAEFPIAADLRLPEVALWYGPTLVTPSVLGLVLDRGLGTVGSRAGWRAASPDDRGALFAGWPVGVERVARGAVWVRDTGDAAVGIAVGPAVPTKPDTGGGSADPAPVKPADPGVGPGSRGSVSAWVGGVVWVAGLLAVVWVAGWGRPGWWPERVAGCGLLGLALTGLWSPAGAVFGLMAAVGWAFRLAWSAGRLARAVAR